MVANVGTDERVHYIRVTNGLDFDFVDRYDGVPVIIPPGKSENLPGDMALHFFGYAHGVDRPAMMKHTAKRHGWNTPEFVMRDPVTRKTKAEDYFDKIKIEVVMYKLVPVDVSDPQAPIPADPQPDVPEAAATQKMKPQRVSVTI